MLHVLTVLLKGYEYDDKIIMINIIMIGVDSFLCAGRQPEHYSVPCRHLNCVAIIVDFIFLNIVMKKKFGYVSSSQQLGFLNKFQLDVVQCLYYYLLMTFGSRNFLPPLGLPTVQAQYYLWFTLRRIVCLDDVPLRCNSQCTDQQI